MQASKTIRQYFTSSLTRKGQVTIPITMRRLLGLKEGDQVEFVVEGKGIMLRPAGSLAARTAGMLAAYGREPALTAEEERAATEQAIAEDVARRMCR